MAIVALVVSAFAAIAIAVLGLVYEAAYAEVGHTQPSRTLAAERLQSRPA